MWGNKPLNKTYSPKLRRPMAHMSSFVTNKIFQRNPWVAVWWSAAFPGCGHLMLCKYFTGFMLMGWEFFINIQAHVNEAIFYSMIGQFDKAKQLLDERWFLLYIAVYVFAMWDSYSLSIDLNKFALLADREDSPVMPFNISALEINYLDHRDAWGGAIWQFFTPGLGYLSLNRLPSAFFMLIWFVVVAYYSHLLPAIQATFIGNFHTASQVLEPEWYLFLPSLMSFATYDVYIQTTAQNQIFKMEQSRFFADNYQTAKLKIPFRQHEHGGA